MNDEHETHPCNCCHNDPYESVIEPDPDGSDPDLSVPWMVGAACVILMIFAWLLCGGAE